MIGFRVVAKVGSVCNELPQSGTLNDVQIASQHALVIGSELRVKQAFTDARRISVLKNTLCRLSEVKHRSADRLNELLANNVLSEVFMRHREQRAN